MKIVRWVFAAALVAAVLTGCSLFFPTELTIRNAASVGIEFIEWNGTRFGSVTVWEPLLSDYVRGLNPGYQDTRDVSPGGDYVYFELQGDITDYRTVEYVDIDRGDDLTFTFYDSTTIVSYDILEVRNESAIGNPVRQYPVMPAERDSAEKKTELP